MTLGEYIKDRKITIIVALVSYGVMMMFLFAFQVNTALPVACSMLFGMTFVGIMAWEYGRRKAFYDRLQDNLSQLDKKYLILEMLSRPDFYEGRLLYEDLYEIDKSMTENVAAYRRQLEDFKEYIEMWIHEAKIPVASLVLMCHNHPGETGQKGFEEQIRRLDRMIDQILYYVRAEHAQKDYHIQEYSLKDIVKKVALYNKDDILGYHIDFSVQVEGMVMTDAKWLAFIINQIVNNSIKYVREDVQPKITIYTEYIEKDIMLVIEDNGIGIDPADLPRVFEKSFTGQNGRDRVKSTGMGLYIADRLCRQLGHKISMASVPGEGTRTEIMIAHFDHVRPE